jgi:translocation and assembly module TamB
MPSPSTDQPGDAPAATPRRPWWQRLLRAIGFGLLGLLLLLTAVWGVLQTEWGAERLKRTIVAQAQVFDDAELQIGSLSGSLLRSLTLTDIALVDADGHALARVDSLHARYRLAPLLRGHIVLDDVSITRPSVAMTQDADGAWDLVEALPLEPDTTDSEPFAYTVSLAAFQLTDGQATARFFQAEQDSTLEVSDLRLQLRDLQYSADTLTAEIPHFTAYSAPPGLGGGVTATLSGALTNESFTVDVGTLLSRRSYVVAEGVLPLTFDHLTATDFSLTTAPLAFADLQPYVSSLDLARVLDLDVRLDGASGRLLVDIEGSLDDGASFALAADASPTLSPVDDEPLRYDLTGTLRNLNPAAFARDVPAAAGRVNADWSAELRGPALNRLNGTLSTDVFDSEVGPYAPARTTFTAAFDDGKAAIDLQSGLRGMTLALNGTTRPLDDMPTYDLTATIADLVPERFLDGASLTGVLGGTARLTGTGLDPQTADATLRLEPAPSTINNIQLTEGSFDVALAGGQAEAQTTLQFGQGQLQGRARVDLRDKIRYTIPEMTFQDLNLAALAADTTASSFSGELALTGEGTALETLTLEPFALSLDQSTYGPYVLETAEASAALTGGRLSATLQAALDGGRFETALAGTPFADEPRLTLSEGRFSAVDIGRLAQLPDQSSDLNGRFELTLTGVTPETLQLRSTAALDSSRVNDQQITTADVSLDLIRGRLTTRAALDLPGGGLTLAGTAEPFRTTPTYAVTEGAFERIDVGAFLGLEALATQLNGTFTLNGTGTDPAALTLDSELVMQPSTLNQAALQSGQGALTVADGGGELSGLFTFVEGTLSLSGQGQWGEEEPSYQLTAALDTLDVAGLLDLQDLPAQLSARVDVAGTGLTPATLELDGTADISDARYGAVTMDTLRTGFRMADGLLTVDSLQVRSNVATLDGGGSIALVDEEHRYTSNFSLTGEARSLRPVGTLLDAPLALDRGTLNVRVFGPPGDVQVQADAELETLLYDVTRVASASLTFEGALDGLEGIQQGDGRLTVGPTSRAALTINGTDVVFSFAENRLQYALEVNLDRRRDASFAGALTVGEDDLELRLEQLDLRLDRDRWELLMPATVRIGDRYRVRNFLLFSDDQQVALDGVIDFAGTQNLILTLEDVRINAFADLLGYPGLGGTLNGSVDLTGPAEAPQLDGRLATALESQDAPVGNLQIDLAYDDLVLALDSHLTHDDGSTLTLDGSVPVDLRLNATGTFDPGGAPLSLALRADTFSIDWLQPFLDPETVENLQGTFTADVAIEGTREAPVFDGQISLAEGGMRLPALGITYTGVQSNVSFEGTEATVETLEARTGRSGRLTGTGTIDLAELTLGTFNLDLQARDFRTIDTREYRATTDADIQLRGTTEEPVIQGSVRVLSAEIFADQAAATDLEVVELSERDIQIINQRFGLRIDERDTDTFDFYEAAEITLDIAFDRNVWIRSRRNPEMNIQFTGSLDFEKERFGEPLAFGAIDVVEQRSYIDQFGRRFNIEQGTLTFNGLATDPTLDVEAVYRVRSRRGQEPEATITLGVEGQLEELEITLSSDPQMETTDIISYIVTGQPASESFLLGGDGGEGEGNGLVGEGVGFAIGQVAGLIENFAGAEFGLDVIEIDQTRGQGTVITAGKFVTRRFFVAVTQPIGLGSTRTSESVQTQSYEPSVQLEYALYDWLLARLAREETGLQVNFVWEYSY